MFLARTFSKIKDSRLKQLAPIQKVISNFCTTTLHPTDKDTEAKHTEYDFDHITDEGSLIEVLEGWKDEDKGLLEDVLSTMRVLPGFVAESEEAAMLAELEPKLRRMRYEFDHWDDAIHGYRETEVGAWGPVGSAVIARVAALAFPAGGRAGASLPLAKQVPSLAPEAGPPPRPGLRALAGPAGAPPGRPLRAQHVLDLAAAGHIKPHVDAVRFCGEVIAGLCLVSSAVMVLQHEAQPRLRLRALLPRRSLYIMRGVSRYSFSHAIPSGKESVWRGQLVPRKRRVAVITRSEPRPEQAEADQAGAAAASARSDEPVGGLASIATAGARSDELPAGELVSMAARSDEPAGDLANTGDRIRTVGESVKTMGDSAKSQGEIMSDSLVQPKPDGVKVHKKTEKPERPPSDEATV